jgi:hypothetical protein
MSTIRSGLHGSRFARDKTFPLTARDPVKLSALWTSAFLKISLIADVQSGIESFYHYGFAELKTTPSLM